METIVILRTNNSEYDIRNASENSISVGKMIEILERCPKDAKIVFDNKHYTFGELDSNTIKVVEVETKEEEKEREKREQEEEERMMEETEQKIEELKSKLTSTYVNTEIPSNDEMVDSLSELIGVKVKHYDEHIDDAVDDEPCGDKYVMCTSFKFKYLGFTFYVSFYYGDISGQIGCVEVDYY